MPEQTSRKGLIIFGAIVFLVLLACFVAYTITGSKGIEERFSVAVGLSSEPEEEADSGFFGFNIEGNIVSYAIILLVLVAACILLYWKFRA